MNTDWNILAEELSVWAGEGLELPFWWRDDDAIDATPHLEQLLDLSNSAGVPVHVAVIPKGATKDLAERLAETDNAVPIVHGFAHRNHEPASEKKCEFGIHRNADAARVDLNEGLEQLGQLFGDRLAPMFAPPWNRISQDRYGDLQKAGYGALSAFAPRAARFAHGNLEQINTHVDPIDWSGNRSLHNCDMLIFQTVEMLKARRSGVQDNSEPLGYLTHHLVHDRAIWDFSGQFLDTIMSGPVRFWTANELQWGARR